MLDLFTLAAVECFKCNCDVTNFAGEYRKTCVKKARVLYTISTQKRIPQDITQFCDDDVVWYMLKYCKPVTVMKQVKYDYTYDMYAYAVQNGCSLTHVPVRYRDYYMCFTAACNNSYNRVYIPPEVFSETFVLEVYENNRHWFVHVRDKTYEMCETALRECGESMMPFVPVKFMCIELVLVMRSVKGNYNRYIRNIDDMHALVTKQYPLKYVNQYIEQCISKMG